MQFDLLQEFLYNIGNKLLKDMEIIYKIKEMKIHQFII